jgi:hypothetical protein
MLEALRRDYLAMSGMIFGEAPPFDKIVEDISGLETELNARVDNADAREQS